MNKLAYAQKMKKLREPQKYKMKIVAGFRQVKKSIKLTLPQYSSKCVLFAVNQQDDPLPGGINETVRSIL